MYCRLKCTADSSVDHVLSCQCVQNLTFRPNSSLLSHRMLSEQQLRCWCTSPQEVHISIAVGEQGPVCFKSNEVFNCDNEDDGSLHHSKYIHFTITTRRLVKVVSEICYIWFRLLNSAEDGKSSAFPPSLRQRDDEEICSGESYRFVLANCKSPSTSS